MRCLPRPAIMLPRSECYGERSRNSTAWSAEATRKGFGGGVDVWAVVWREGATGQGPKQWQ